MKKSIRKAASLTGLCAGVLAVGSAVHPLQAQTSDALLNALIKKGVLTEQEAEGIKSDLAKENQDISKIKVNSNLSKFEIYGDARLRFEFREGQNSDSESLIRRRWRYRVRFGFKGEYQERLYYGLRLETSESGRSSNLTFGENSSNAFDKSDFEMRIGRIYLGYKPTDWLAVEGGKVALPFETTTMVWDSDINPEGVTEKFHYSFDDQHLDVFANFGQYLYDTVDPFKQIGVSTPNEAWLLGWQVGAAYHFNEDMSLQLAPTIYNYIGDGNDPLTRTFAPAETATTSFVAINDLLVFQVPVAFKWQAVGLPWKVFGDFAVNLKGSDRRDAAVAAGGVPVGTDTENLAYQVGLQVGSAKKKGTWEAKVFWQHAELFALDANLVDSDIFDSKLNMEGIAVKLGYAFTDSIYGNLTYAYGDAIENNLGTGTGGDIRINPLFDYQVFQADLSWKF